MGWQTIDSQIMGTVNSVSCFVVPFFDARHTLTSSQTRGICLLDLNVIIVRDFLPSVTNHAETPGDPICHVGTLAATVKNDSNMTGLVETGGIEASGLGGLQQDSLAATGPKSSGHR